MLLPESPPVAPFVESVLFCTPSCANGLVGGVWFGVDDGVEAVVFV